MVLRIAKELQTNDLIILNSENAEIYRTTEKTELLTEMKKHILTGNQFTGEMTKEIIMSNMDFFKAIK